MNEGRQERKVVTVLFCDLVGFTQRAEEMDPEDVASLLGPYHARVKSELERYGGTVEKFIGDAVMALFGAPVAHEDDPERAVRAALAIRDFAEEDGIELRIGITTGEALVTLAARPDQGETMATGDVVNTAARLQAAAPVNGILVSGKTHAATRDAIEYEPAAAVEAKGKSKPIDVWRARSARGRIVLDRLHATPLVGRARELDLLLDSLHRARAERQPQLVTVVGVPGIGKSRLVYELSQAVDRDPELISWRQGRCLPYGEGVTFWGLGEIVKAHLGVLETDSSELVEQKLREGVVDEWVRAHLRPLVGLAAETSGREDQGQEEAFAAWRRFLEDIAVRGPLVVVFEDLHWADESLLDFIDHLVDWASGIPVLVVCTARPELFERRSGWGGGKTNALTISLSPLADDDTSRLVAGLVRRAVMPAETQNALLARAGGNPLYAEQYARLLEERVADELPLPETVQGIISARLDGLDSAQKALLQDAAAVGKVFWLGAIASISGTDRTSAERALHALERRGFVRRERESSIEGDAEYSFLHVLVPEVAYGQLPRAPRAEKHRLVAAWLETQGRTEDQAETLAFHYDEALRLTAAAGLAARELEEPARRAFRDAGDRAFTLNAYAAAARYYEQALELWPEGDAELPVVLFRYARSVQIGIDDTRVELFDRARDAFLAAGDSEGAAEAETYGALALRGGGRSLDALERSRAAVKRIADAPASARKTYIVANLARMLAVSGYEQEGLALAESALESADRLQLFELKAHALNTIGLGRVLVGEVDGVEMLEESLRIAREHGSLYELGRIYNNLDASYLIVGRIEDACAIAEERVLLAERFGFPSHDQRETLAFLDLLLGRWGETRRLIDELLAAGVSNEGISAMQADLLLAAGDTASAREASEMALAELRTQQPDEETRALLRAFLCQRARIALAEGDERTANELTDELLAIPVPMAREFPSARIDLALLLLDLGRRSEGATAAPDARGLGPWVDIGAAILEQQLVGAANRLAELKMAPAEAEVRFRAAKLLLAEGRRAEADLQLRQALAFWREVGASGYTREAEALLAATA